MKRLLTVSLIALTLVGGIWWYFNTQTAQADTVTDRQSIIVEAGSVISSVKATSRLEAETEVALNFEIAGTIAEIMVEQGQIVRAGEPLARLDAASLELQLAQAEASLAQIAAGAHPADIAAAEATAQSAQINYEKVIAGAEEEDLTAAESALISAWANYNALEEGPGEDELTVAAAAFRNAEIDLRRAQEAYDEVAYADNLGQLPQASELQRATIAYESALATYKITIEPAAAEQLQSAWNQVVQAQTALDKLKNGASDEDIALAQVEIVRAQAQLQRLLDTPTAEDLIVAELQVDQAELNLEKATLVAPIAGVVTDVNVTVGEQPVGSAIVITDLSALHINLSIDEIDLIEVAVNQPAVITLDALPNQPMSGQVIDIAPAPEASSTGVAGYEVAVALNKQNSQAKVGMTANVEIETGRRDNVLVIPANLLQVDPTTGQTYVEVSGADGQAVRRDVTLGLRSGQQIEVLDGLNAGDRILIPVVEEITVKMESAGPPGFGQ